MAAASILALPMFAVAVFPTRTAAHQEDKVPTIEYCKTTNQCHPGLTYEGVKDRSSAGPYTNSKDLDYCVCLLRTTLNYCDSSSQCHDGEACAINTNTGDEFCTGCDAIVDDSRTYGLVDPSYPQCDVALEKPEKPWRLGQRYDLCSPDVLCLGDFQCIWDN